MQKTHSDPQHRPELVERYSYGWCHGPAGDGQVFRLLAQVTGDPVWRSLAARATVDTHGARWSDYEHRASPPVLAPRTGWAMGNAGIIRELLRYARIRSRPVPGYAIAWPDHTPPAQQATTGA
jgi:Lanthionine synthetase C-like protein